MCAMSGAGMGCGGLPGDCRLSCPQPGPVSVHCTRPVADLVHGMAVPHRVGWAFTAPYSFRNWREQDWKSYLDILAYRLGIDLDEAIVSKFNRVSERVGCDVKLHYPMDASAQTVKVLFTRGGSMVWADCFHAAEEALKNEVGKLTCLVGCHDPESIADLFCRLCRGRPVQRIGTEPPTHLRYTGSTLLPDGSVPQS